MYVFTNEKLINHPIPILFSLTVLSISYYHYLLFSYYPLQKERFSSLDHLLYQSNIQPAGFRLLYEVLVVRYNLIALEKIVLDRFLCLLEHPENEGEVAASYLAVNDLLPERKFGSLGSLIEHCKAPTCALGDHNMVVLVIVKGELVPCAVVLQVEALLGLPMPGNLAHKTIISLALNFLPYKHIPLAHALNSFLLVSIPVLVYPLSPELLRVYLCLEQFFLVFYHLY